MELVLNDEQVEVLQMMVQKDIHELLMEIANTDDRKYRNGLKAKEDVLVDILSKLSAIPAS